MDKLKSMLAFVLTVETGSFASASVKLHVSPQRVAKAVAGLEQQTGMRLLLRTTRRQVLTEFGRHYYQRCRLILHEIDAADALAQQMKTKPEGTLLISAPVTFGNTTLMPFISRFLQDYPAIEFDIDLTDSLSNLAAGEIDIAFRIGDNLDPGLVARALLPYQLVVCAAPDYLARRGMPPDPQALAEHDCLGFAHWDRQQMHEWRFMQNGKLISVPVRGRLRVNDSYALLAAALAGSGILMAPEVLAHEALAQRKLIPLLTAFISPPRPMHLLYRPDRQRMAKLSVFIEAVMRTFGKHYANQA